MWFEKRWQYFMLKSVLLSVSSSRCCKGFLSKQLYLAKPMVFKKKSDSNLIFYMLLKVVQNKNLWKADKILTSVNFLMNE